MSVFPIDAVHLKHVDGGWPVEPGVRTRIDDHWQAAVTANPHLWNGKVLGTIAPGRPGGVTIEDGMLFGEAVEGDFAAFLAWRDWGFPEIGIRNLFGSALVRSGDGALLYGVMAGTTANAGKIYPPGGSLEPGDIDAFGNVNVIASIERELSEETGLDVRDARFEAMYAAFDGPRISIGRVYRFDAPARELAATIAATLDTQAERELERIEILTRKADLSRPGIMPYARTFGEMLLEG